MKNGIKLDIVLDSIFGTIEVTEKPDYLMKVNIVSVMEFDLVIKMTATLVPMMVQHFDQHFVLRDRVMAINNIP